MLVEDTLYFKVVIISCRSLPIFLSESPKPGVSTTVKSLFPSLPRHGPEAKAVALVQLAVPGHIGNRQSSHIGDCPSKTSAMLDLPTPVPPKIVMIGWGKSFL